MVLKKISVLTKSVASIEVWYVQIYGTGCTTIKKVVLRFGFRNKLLLRAPFSLGLHSEPYGTSLNLSCTYRTIFCLQTCITA